MKLYKSVALALILAMLISCIGVTSFAIDIGTNIPDFATGDYSFANGTYYLINADGRPITDNADSENYNVYCLYDDESGTTAMTLNNAALKYKLYLPGNVNITLLGENSIGTSETPSAVNTAIQCQAGFLTFGGTGSLDIHGVNGSIVVSGDETTPSSIVFKDSCTINIPAYESSNSNSLIQARYGNVSICDEADVTVNNITAFINYGSQAIEDVAGNVHVYDNGKLNAVSVTANNKMLVENDAYAEVKDFASGSFGFTVKDNAEYIGGRIFSSGNILIDSTVKTIVTSATQGAVIELQGGVQTPPNELRIKSELDVTGFVGLGIGDGNIIVDGGILTVTSTLMGVANGNFSTALTNIEFINGAEAVFNINSAADGIGLRPLGNVVINNSTVTVDASGCANRGLAYFKVPVLSDNSELNGYVVTAGTDMASALPVNKADRKLQTYYSPYVKIEPKHTSTLSFNLGGGTVEDGSLYNDAEYNIGETVVLPVAPEKDGCEFLGWNLVMNGTGTSYAAGDDFEITNSDVTLYAILRYTAEAFDEKIANDNLTDVEKVEIINNVNIDSLDVAESVSNALANLPAENREQISIDTFNSLKNQNASTDIIIAKDNDANPEVIATALPNSGFNNLSVAKVESDAITNNSLYHIVHSGNVEAKTFDVSLTDGAGNRVPESTTPIYIEFTVEDSSIIEKIIRDHDGVLEEVPFTVIDDTTVAILASKFSTYTLIVSSPIAAGSAVLNFVNPIETENGYAFDLALTGDSEDVLEQFESGEFALVLTGDFDMEVTAESGLAVSDLGNGEFHVERTAAAATAGTYPAINADTSIKLATVTITGIGDGAVAVDTVKPLQMFRKVGDNVAFPIPTTGGSATFTIEPEYCTLSINIIFPNKITNQVTSYQDMKLEITGSDGTDLSYNLGSNSSADVVFDAITGRYTVILSDRFIKNYNYNVTVSGAGYRTARCNVNMTADKTLNFWNNVKDTAAEIEVGDTTTETTKNFLAGDIVRDGVINIYDLSAVVAYFGEINVTDAASAYAKYDLNRDGVIDSFDVALVLVSWGE